MLSWRGKAKNLLIHRHWCRPPRSGTGKGALAREGFKAANLEGQVLSRDAGFDRPYGQDPYVGYDRVDNPPFLSQGDLDGRLQPKERVAAVTIGDAAAAFPFSVLEKWLSNYTVGGQEFVVFFKPGTRSAPDDLLIGNSPECFTPVLGSASSVGDLKRRYQT